MPKVKRAPRLRAPDQPGGAFALPPYWSPEQALAVFECIELIRDQIWQAYGPDIQRAWRAQLVKQGAPSDLDPDQPF